ncbi:MAG: response regulator [Sporomusaceae bacterium]|nr:response regulator [Sporomusaceae bacterium]
MREIIQGAKIMIVDDTPFNLTILTKMLESLGACAMTFTRGWEALASAEKTPPDLILLDITMPEMDGFEVCRKVKESIRLKDIPVIFISSLTEIRDKMQAFDVGAVDYITKPFDVREVELRVRTHLKIVRLQRRVDIFNQQLQQLVQEQYGQILKEQNKVTEAQTAMIVALAKLSECRDNDTGAHLDRVKYYCQILAKDLVTKSLFSTQIDEKFINVIMYAATLHDIGKVGIPDRILLKPGKLTVEEFEVMKTHTTLGAITIARIVAKYPDNSLLTMAMDIAQSHHENWDGTGYPFGLKGTFIPLCARIMAIADVYDALRSKRPYKNGFSHEDTCAIIVHDKGKKFDPDLVDAFVEINGAFAEVFEQNSELGRSGL